MAKKLVCKEAGFDCDFAVQSGTEDEVVQVARQHAEQIHDTEIPRSQLEEHVKTV